MKKYTLWEQGDTALTECKDGEYYLASEVDAAMESDGKKVAGLILEKANRIAELEKALRWHVGERHDKFCLMQEGRSTCNCGHDLLQR